MQVRCGTDIIEVKRIEGSLKSNSRFAGKVFTDAEIEYCENRKAGRYESYAARFTAKEAFMKALGTGLFGGAALTEIEVVNSPGVDSGAEAGADTGVGADDDPVASPGAEAGADTKMNRVNSGAPSLRLHGGAADLYRQIGGVSMSLSLSHTADTALAVVVILCGDGSR